MGAAQLFFMYSYQQSQLKIGRIFNPRTFLRVIFALTVLIFGLILLAPRTRAANGINSQINYQAKLLDTAGEAVADGNYSIKFSLYTAATGGTPVWTAKGTTGSPTALTVAVADGLFTVALGDTSSGGGSQNALTGIDWNSDGLYLGVTIGSDAEMTPRKRLTSVPQAFNAQQIQGMYASSTASGFQSLFTINQTDSSVATGTRTALVVQSSGVSNANDYLIRAVNSSSTDAFSVSRQGNVTSTGYLTVTGSGTSSFSGQFSIAGNVTLGDSSSDVIFANGSFATGLTPYADGTYSLGSSANRWNAYFSSATSTSATSTDFYGSTIRFATATGTALSVNGAIFGQVTSTSATSTDLYASTLRFANASGTSATATSLYAYDLVTNGLRIMTADSGVLTLGSNSIVSNATYLNIGGGGVITLATIHSNLTPYVNNATDIGEMGAAWRNIYTSGTIFGTNAVLQSATATDLFATMGRFTTVTSTTIRANSLTAANAVITGGDINSTIIGGSQAASATFTFLSSTAGLTFMAATGTNATATDFYGTAIRFASATGTTINANDASFARTTSTSATSTDLYAATMRFGSASGTNVSTTNLYGEKAQFISVTTTNFAISRALSVSPTTSTIALLGTFATPVGPQRMTVQGRNLFVASDNGIITYDRTNPSGLRQLALATAVSHFDITSDGSHVYAANYNTGNVGILDYTDPSSPSETSYAAGGNIQSIVRSGKYLYVATFNDDTITTLDVSNPSSISLVSAVSSTATGIQQIAVHNGLLLAVGTSGVFEAFTLANGGVPAIIGATSTGLTLRNVVVDGSYAYVTNDTNDSVSVVSYSSSSAPIVVATMSVGSQPRFPALNDRTLYVPSAGDGYVYVIDVSNPRVPVMKTRFSVGSGIRQVLVDGRTMYVLDYGSNLIATYDLGGLRTHSLVADAAEVGSLFAVNGARVGGSLSVEGTIMAGAGGIFSNGTLGVYGGSGTSTIASRLQIGTTAANLLLFAGGAGPTITTTDSSLVLTAANRLILPDASGVSLGAAGATFNAVLGSATATSATSSDLYATMLRFATATGVSFSANGALFGQVTSTSATSTDLFAITGRFTTATGTTINGNIIAAGSFSSPSVTISGGTINGTTIGASSASTGIFTYVTSTSATSTDFFATTLRYTNARGTNTTTSRLYAYDTIDQAITSESTPIVLSTVAVGLDPVDMETQGDYLYTLNDNGGASTGSISIISLANPASPTMITTSTLVTENPSTMTISPDYLYVSAGSKMKLYGLHSPGSTSEVANIQVGVATDDVEYAGGRLIAAISAADGLYSIPATQNNEFIGDTSASFDATDVDVQGRYAYALNSASATFAIVDISDAGNLVITASSSIGTTPSDIVVQGRHAYVTDSGENTIKIIDVASSSNPFIVASLDIATTSTGVFVSGRYAYVTGSDNKLHIIDVLTPSSPSEVRTIGVGTGPQAVIVKGRYAYVMNVGSDDITVIDILGVETNGLVAHTAALGSATVRTNLSVYNQVVVGGNVSIGDGGLYTTGPIITHASGTTSTFAGNVSILGRLTAPGLSLSEITVEPGSADTFTAVTSTGFGSSISNADLIVSGRYTYIVTGHEHRLKIIDTTNAQQPRLVTSTRLTSPGNALALSGRYLYIGSTSGTVNIVDVSNPYFPQVVATTTAQVGATPLGDVVKLILRGKYLYVGHSAGITIVDVSDSFNPIPVGFYSVASAVYSMDLQGDYIYYNSGGFTGFKILDISNPSSPFERASYSSGLGNGSGIKVQGNYVYYLGNDTLSVVNISSAVNPISSPFFVGSVVANGGSNYKSIDIAGKYVVIQTTNQMIRIYDVSDPTAPTLVDTIFTDVTGGGSLVIAGSYIHALNSGDSSYRLYGLKGIQTSALTAASIEAGSLQVRRDGTIFNNLSVGGGLNIGQGGLFSQGALAVYATSSLSSIAGGVLIGGINTSTAPFWASIANNGASVSSNRLMIGQNQNMDVVIGAATATYTGNGLFAFSGNDLYVEGHAAVRGSLFTTFTYASSAIIGSDFSSTGTADYSMVITYASSSKNGLCIDATDVGGSCPTGLGYSIVTDGSIGANLFDLAEEYASSGPIEKGDLVVFDLSTNKTVMRSSGVAYDSDVIGVVSTAPGFVLGTGGGTPVALSGRVPTHVSPVNGAIQVGDLLTSSPYPGVAMKATRPGRVIGRALEPASATSTIEVFIQVGYDMSSLLAVDGSMTFVQDSIVMASREMASSATTTVDSWGLTFRGSAWNGIESVTSDFTLFNQVESAASSSFVLQNSSGTSLLAISQAGEMEVNGDLAIAGRLYPSARGTIQKEAYIFVDDSQGATSTYISTNASGWQADDAYDFAERYYSPDKLEPGDIVVVREEGQLHVQRALDSQQMVIGIVSTKPGFVTGRATTSTYPIALMGRVPTKVSTINGEIKVGDLLAPSSIPGVAVKAITAGPIVGQALEAYQGDDVGKIEVFVKPIWWGGGAMMASATDTQGQATTTMPMVAGATTQRGFALIISGGKKVRVSYASIGGYPNVQVTPRGEVEGGWWTDNYSDIGFDIILKQEQSRDVTFAWRVEAIGEGESVSMSDGTTASINSSTGFVIQGTETTASSTESLSEEPVELTDPVIDAPVTPLESIVESEEMVVAPETQADPVVAEPVIPSDPVPVEVVPEEELVAVE